MLKKADLSKSLMIITFLAPALAFYLVFYLYPVVSSLILGFYRWDGISISKQFIGFENYKQMSQDPNFWNSLVINIKATVFSLLQLPLALLLAELLSKAGPLMRFFRSVLFIPQMLSTVAVALLWTMIYHPINGLANHLLGALGLPYFNWLGDPNNALMSAIITTIWAGFGFHMILQLAGRSSIPTEIYDATSLETSNPFEVFFRITLPLLRETIMISLVMIISGSFSYLMGLFWALTQGGPEQGTQIVGIYIYIQAFKNLKVGYANAVSVVILFMLTAVLLIVIWFGSRERIEY
jgi:ABC-type sugar transport system permease subunit